MFFVAICFFWVVRFSFATNPPSALPTLSPTPGQSNPPTALPTSGPGDPTPVPTANWIDHGDGKLMGGCTSVAGSTWGLGPVESLEDCKALCTSPEYRDQCNTLNYFESGLQCNLKHCDDSCDGSKVVGCAGCEGASLCSAGALSQGPEGCQDTYNWDNFYGDNCDDYAMTLCDGFGLGEQYNFPENNCCACKETPDTVIPPEDTEEQVAEEQGEDLLVEEQQVTPLDDTVEPVEDTNEPVEGENECPNCNEIEHYLHTRDNPEWDFERSGFLQRDGLSFAIEYSTCNDEILFAFGEGPIELEDWEEWNIANGATFFESETCNREIVQKTYSWSNSSDELFVIEYPVTSERPSGTEEFEFVHQADDSCRMETKFVQYGGCLNTREVRDTPVEFADRQLTYHKFVENAHKFTVAFPTVMRLCTKIKIDKIPMLEVVVGQRVYCSNSAAGWEADLYFRTYIPWPYKMNQDQSTFGITVEGAGEGCFDTYFEVDTTSTENPKCDSSDKESNPICVQDWAVHVVPHDDCDSCYLDGDYIVTVKIDASEEAKKIKKNEKFISPTLLDSTRTFTIDVQSSNICPQVIAQVSVAQEMDAYHDAMRTRSDRVFVQDDNVYVEAIFSSPEAVIANIVTLEFSVTNEATGEKHILDTSDFADTGFQYDNPGRSSRLQKFIWPRFTLNHEYFGIVDAEFPIDFSINLLTNVSFVIPNDGNVELLEMTPTQDFVESKLALKLTIAPTSVSVGKSQNDVTGTSLLTLALFIAGGLSFVVIAVVTIAVVQRRRKYRPIETVRD